MAKEFTPQEIAEWFTNKGLTVPDELKSKVENAVEDSAETVILEHLSESNVKSAEEWRKRLFELAEMVSSEFKGQEKNVGQGRVFERYVELELANGVKFAIRHREPREKK